MAMDFSVDITATEMIKPSSPTPNDLKTFKLSYLDQLAPDVYPNTIFFYNTIAENSNEISRRLKKSLSEVLCHFYPLAGRIKGNISIECNDEGAYYVETQVNCHLSDFLRNPKIESLQCFLPTDVLFKEVAAVGCPLIVQANFFTCGGLAIGLCASHKITDGATVSTFIRCWTTTAVEPGNALEEPKFMASSLFPPMECSIKLPEVNMASPERCVTRRYVFDAFKIAQLKDKCASAGVQQPTRVEAVTALTWKCALKASKMTLGLQRPSMLIQVVNLRQRVSPPLSESTFGNVFGYFAMYTGENACETKLKDLVYEMRKELREYCNTFVKRLEGDEAVSVFKERSIELGNRLKDGDIELYNISSWCKFHFYEADFGWGKPAWVSNAGIGLNNFIILTDTKEGNGIEAWISLGEEKMALFEQDQEFLSFAVLNPSVLI